MDFLLILVALALIAFTGGLIALWPGPRRAPSRVSAAYAARVGREVRVPA